MKQTNSSLHTVLLALLLEGGHLGPVPSQNAASRHPLSSRHLTPYLNWHDSVQHGPCTTHICWFFNFFIKYNCKYLRRWASGRRPQSTRPLSGLLDTAHGETALFLAIFLPSTIAFFARFHHSVAANCTLGLFFFLKKNKKVLLYIEGRLAVTCETALLVAGFGAEDTVNALEAAGWEFVIISLIARGGTGKHDVVSVLAAWSAVPVIFRIVLCNANKIVKNRIKIYISSDW